MRHLIISRELPPAAYPAGGIGTYVANIARLLAEHGDTVHVIGERWKDAPSEREVLLDGRLVLHRIGVSDLPPVPEKDAKRARQELRGLRESAFPQQWFAWGAAYLAEQLVEQEGVEVIEAQEWEAPLYYFLVRRSLGLGPGRRPPCIVHLHSPSVFIHHYNNAETTPASLPWKMRMEAFCIEAADALLCPSRTVAAQAAHEFRVAAQAVEVIPLPMGLAPRIDRDEAVWAEGAISFIGRLEPRKGVFEWVEAATRIAREHPNVRFDFIGADIANLQTTLSEQIGRALAPRFRFHGPKSREQIANMLATAMAGVVPSRWENFPNVCVEEMASGLPVIATRYGAMADLIEDGRSGWLAEETGLAGMADSLADALRRCLATPPAQRAAMGQAAAERVRRICDNNAVVAAHRQFRSAILARASSSGSSTPAKACSSPRIVVRASTPQAAKGVLRSLEAQTIAPEAVVVVFDQLSKFPPSPQSRRRTTTELLYHYAPALSSAQAWNQGFALLDRRESRTFWLFLDEHDSLEPDCLERMADVFASRPDLGVVSPWTERMGSSGYMDVRPSPSLAHQMTSNDVSPASGFNAQALDRSGPFRPGLPREYDVWALANDVIARGWAAATLPCLLLRRESIPSDEEWAKATALRAIRAEALRPFDKDEHRLALELIDRFVPIGVPKEGPKPTGQRLRRLFIRKLETVLLRPGHVLRRAVRAVPRPSRAES
jgi:glycosyltransferase involved in cell wall biosynthesis